MSEQPVTVLDRMVSAGVDEDRARAFVLSGAVIIDGERISDPTTPASPPARIVILLSSPTGAPNTPWPEPVTRAGGLSPKALAISVILSSPGQFQIERSLLAGGYAPDLTSNCATDIAICKFVPLFIGSGLSVLRSRLGFDYAGDHQV